MAGELSVLFILVVFSRVYAQDYEIKECLSGQPEDVPETIKVICPADTRISIEKSIYGRNKWGLCYQVAEDCTEQIDLFESCNGKESCSVRLDRTYSKKCGYATFLRVLYDCVSDKVVVTETQIDPQPQSTENKVMMYSPPIAIKDTSTNKITGDASNYDNAGLIAGSAVAVVITILMLLLAIYLVIKRLFRPPPCDKHPDDTVHQKPDIVIFDMLCCCIHQSHPIKQRPVADQNQNIATSTSLRISDRPVPIGEVTVTTVNEFGQTNNTTVNNRQTDDSSETPNIVESSQSQSQVNQNNPRSTEVNNENSAIGLPNTRSFTTC